MNHQGWKQSSEHYLHLLPLFTLNMWAALPLNNLVGKHIQYIVVNQRSNIELAEILRTTEQRTLQIKDSDCVCEREKAIRVPQQVLLKHMTSISAWHHSPLQRAQYPCVQITLKSWANTFLSLYKTQMLILIFTITLCIHITI